MARRMASSWVQSDGMLRPARWQINCRAAAHGYPQGGHLSSKCRAIVGAALPDSGGQSGRTEYLDTMETGMSKLQRREPALAHGAVWA